MCCTCTVQLGDGMKYSVKSGSLAFIPGEPMDPADKLNYELGCTCMHPFLVRGEVTYLGVFSIDSGGAKSEPKSAYSTSLDVTAYSHSSPC